MGRLFYGDNLPILRGHIEDESVDLIYLDPPFNSNASYNILFRSPQGVAADSQIEAFHDTWHYGAEAAQAFHEVTEGANSSVAALLMTMQGFLGQNALMAYLAMMAVRIIELHRVLKPTGSLYLHCDATASHYLKILLDGVFGANRFRNEIIWERSNAHNLRTAGWTRSNDTLLFYTKSDRYTFNQLYVPYGPEQLKRFKADADGRLFKAENLTFSSANKTRQFEWRGTRPPAHRSWGASVEQLEQWWAEGRILKRQDGSPRMDGLKVFLDDLPGKPIGSNWTDIDRIGNTSGERLGYPTQKPLALLERIVAASSNSGDVVLDPFCGCGTAVHAAQKMGRRWLGIDITFLAIGLIGRRLHGAFPGLNYDVVGEPNGLMDAEHLAKTHPYQFQYWIIQKLGGQPLDGGRKGPDRGIDGFLYYTRNDARPGKSGTAAAIVSVKAGRHIGAAMIRDLVGVLHREKRDMGIFVCVHRPSRDMEREASGAGYWDDPVTGKSYPKIQIFTLPDLFEGRLPRLPLADAHAGFRPTRKEGPEQQTLF